MYNLLGNRAPFKTIVFNWEKSKKPVEVELFDEFLSKGDPPENIH